MPTTELDDLKAAWQTLNRNLERQHALTLHQVRKRKMTRFRSGLRTLVAGQVIQLICGAILAGLSARFWITHPGTPHLAMYGLLLHAYGIMFIAFAVRDLVLIRQIDYAAPVVAIQKQIAALRAWHLRAGVWFALVGSFIWAPSVLAIFYWFGVDLWAADPNVKYWFIVNDFVCLGLTYMLVCWLRLRRQSRLTNYLQGELAGRSVNRAQAMLDEIARFEQE